ILFPPAKSALQQLVRKAEAQAATRPAAIFATIETLASSAMKKLGVTSIDKARYARGIGGLRQWLGRKGIGAEYNQGFFEDLAQSQAAGAGETSIEHGKSIISEMLQEGTLSTSPADLSKLVVSKDPLVGIKPEYLTLSESELSAIIKYTRSEAQDRQYWISTRLARKKYQEELDKVASLKEQLQESRLGYSGPSAEDISTYETVEDFKMYEIKRKQLIHDRAIAHEKQKEGIKMRSLPAPTEQNPIKTNKKRIQHQVRDQKTKQGHLFQGPGGSIL